MGASNVIPAGEIKKQKDIMQRVREAVQAQPEPLLAYIDTYGCQQNESDSEKLRGMLVEMGCSLTGDEFKADIIVINTCAIRENAENRVLGNVGELIHAKKAKPSQIVVFCGCLAGVPETVEKVKNSYRHVDLVFSPDKLWKFPELLCSVVFLETGEAGSEAAMLGEAVPVTPVLRKRALRAKERVFDTKPDNGAIAEGIPQHRDGTVKAWLPVMYGCDNFCSYCIVPYVRGRERSREPGVIVEEARALIENGYKDMTLLGQNVNSYGGGLSEKTDFAALIRRINDIKGEYLIRFMTSHPKDASLDLFRAMAESEHAARHIHLPFQAGNDRILKLMNRGYTKKDYLEKVAAARELMPDIVITSDVIVGFPGETNEEFEDTLSLVEEARFDAMFTFIYSKRPGTPAAKLPDTTTRGEKQLRFDRLIELQNAVSEEKHMQYVGKIVRVLVDGQSRDEKPAEEQSPPLPVDDAHQGACLNPALRFPLKARTNGGRLVHLPGDAGLVGSFINAEITHCNSWSLFGKALV